MISRAHSIKHRLTLYIVVSSVFFTAVTILAQFILDYKEETKLIEARLESHVKATIGPLSEALWDLDFEQMEALLEGLHTVPFVCNIELQAKDGTHFLLVDDHPASGERMKYSLYHNARELGYLAIAIDLHAIKDRMIDKFVVVVATNAIKTFLMLLCIFAFVTQIVTKPLSSLYNSVSMITTGPLRKVFVPESLKRKEDEIGVLALSIVDLQQQARSALAKQLLVERKLRLHQSKLQKTVEERTAEIDRQSKINKVLADMSLDIITHNSRQADQIIYNATVPMGEYLEVDRISLIEFDGQFARYKHAWRADGKKKEVGEGFDVSRLLLFKRRLLSMEPIIVDDIVHLKGDAQDEYELLNSQGVTSIAAFPLIDGTKVFGLLIAAHTDAVRVWEVDVISILTRFASAVSELHIHEKNRLAMNHLQEELIEANERLQVIAETDELTGLVNRRPFKRELEVALDSDGVDSKIVSLLMIDIDHFKRYNDEYGHVQGDIALRYVARSLSQILSPNGHMVARIGGEEFAAILTDLTKDEVATLGQQVCDSVVELAIPHQGSEANKVLTVSIGAVILGLNNCVVPTVSETMELADAALYRAKREGRNRLIIDDQSNNTNFGHETLL